MLLLCLLFATSLKELNAHLNKRLSNARALDKELHDSIITKMDALDKQIQSLNEHADGNADVIDRLMDERRELHESLFSTPNEDRLVRDTHSLGLDPQSMSNYKQLLKTTDEDVKQQLDDASESCKNGKFDSNYLFRFKYPQRYLENNLFDSFKDVLRFSKHAFKFYNCMVNKIDGEARAFVKLEMQVLRLTE